jgi:hypothetical protein
MRFNFVKLKLIQSDLLNQEITDDMNCLKLMIYIIILLSRKGNERIFKKISKIVKLWTEHELEFGTIKSIELLKMNRNKRMFRQSPIYSDCILFIDF